MCQFLHEVNLFFSDFSVCCCLLFGSLISTLVFKAKQDPEAQLHLLPKCLDEWSASTQTLLHRVKAQHWSIFSINLWTRSGLVPAVSSLVAESVHTNQDMSKCLSCKPGAWLQFICYISKQNNKNSGGDEFHAVVFLWVKLLWVHRFTSGFYFPFFLFCFLQEMKKEIDSFWSILIKTSVHFNVKCFIFYTHTFMKHQWLEITQYWFC